MSTIEQILTCRNSQFKDDGGGINSAIKQLTNIVWKLLKKKSCKIMKYIKKDMQNENELMRKWEMLTDSNKHG